MIILKWIGDGKLVIPGFPSHDLTKQDLEKLMYHARTVQTVDELKKQLIGTGLYAAIKQSKKVSNGNN